MDPMTRYYIFFSGLFLTGIATVILLTILYRRTKGATKAWKYLAFFGITNAVGGMIGLVRGISTIEWLNQASFFVQAFFNLLIAYWIILASAYFIKDFGIKLPFFNKINMLALTGFILAVLVLLNIGSFDVNPGPKAYTIANFVVAFALLLIIIPDIKLAMTFKRAPWYLLLASALISGIALFVLSYTDSCCSTNGGPLVADEVCSTHVSGMVNVFPMYCSLWMQNFYVLSVGLLLIGSLTAVGSYYMFWRIMS